ncbi:hypothetical protein CNMCM6936_003040 [Aspergillus lentulus]|uniref:Uncharacterized protein n=1 Tax=Aspergillus lentulus TaxID=293939 RepID=A0AAN6BNY7_ASPLE|nr:hypothetical protein CNMCM6936_003040 [Aspergillus lentulus]KAF4184398.1 hypothetical protein CNMCM7927_008107 [Aspergillus lentulus]KAF4204472.1 hypothetical protein CNMCM8927_007414 [Aspergillus lentulus]
MADLFRKLFLFGDAQIPPPTHINVAVTVSSSTLHKHGSDDEFYITLEATLPQTLNTPDKPLTILVFGTLLDPSGIALYENGFNFININTGAPAKRPSLTKHYSFGGMSDIPIEPQFERYFVTLQPGVPHQVRFTLWPCPRNQQHNKDNPERLRAACGELLITNEDEAIVAAGFSQVTYLEVGSTYRVEFGNKLNLVPWYRYGLKEQVLEGQGAGTIGTSKDQQLPWKVLGKSLGLPTIDQGQYWLNTAPYLDNLLIQCGYDVHKQYQYLAFFHRHVLPVLGPFIRSSVEANYISGFSAEGYPMELSLNYQPSKATVRLGCEPVGEFAGTSQDPMNP